MNKIMILFVCGIAAVIALLLAAKWLTYKIRKKIGVEGLVELPLAVRISGVVIAGAVIMYRVLVAAGEAVDIWMKLRPVSFFKSIATTCCLLLGMGLGWLLLLAGISSGFVALILAGGAKKGAQVEADPLAYALAKATLLLAACLVLLPVADALLLLCLPTFNLTYFH